MKCPRCQSENFVKSGMVKNRQRFLCKNCDYQFSITSFYSKPAEIKRSAIQLYLEGLNLREIGSLLQINHVSVYNWLTKFGPTLDDIRRKEKLNTVSIDLLHEYLNVQNGNSASLFFFKDISFNQPFLFKKY